MLALARRAREGGTYRVSVSLCQSTMLLAGVISGFDETAGQLEPTEFERYAVADDATAYGDLKSLGPVIRMSETAPRWSGTTRCGLAVRGRSGCRVSLDLGWGGAGGPAVASFDSADP